MVYTTIKPIETPWSNNIQMLFFSFHLSDVLRLFLLLLVHLWADLKTVWQTCTLEGTFSYCHTFIVMYGSKPIIVMVIGNGCKFQRYLDRINKNPIYLKKKCYFYLCAQVAYYKTHSEN